ncbi:hypothetical protein EV191_1011054 [Tamaricihabitans halophyticus]|uniref:AbrB family transcriptional regulator n=1 Tax=Tamaricihabitans halophyticus TaxID=1262583 RepID=A0A4R2R2V5_9PSEU|nr:AbrB family transcriptional regulator [Tamaricihabitans halophyticus]TCP57102.1 hypothetical protein EV191_1011054 [Tamaricihabitans halophyticus]
MLKVAGGTPRAADAGARGRSLFAIELLIAGISGGALFAVTGQEVIWLLGGVFGGWLACRIALARGRPAAPSPGARKSGQVLVGAAIGPSIASQTLHISAGQLVLLGTAVLAVLLCSILVARVYYAASPVDGVTAGMATLPGGIGIMPAVAAEYGKPVGLVAIVQSFRMTLVVALVLVAHEIWSTSDSSTTGERAGNALLPAGLPGWGYVAGLLLGAVCAAWLAGKLRIPVPTLLGPLLFGCGLALGLRALGVDADLLTAPFLQEIIGQGLLGLTVGEYLAQRYWGSAAALSGGIVGVLASCALAIGIALGLAAIGPWPFLTTLLMVAPGGAPEMAMIAAATGGELALVLAAQTGRQVLVNLLIPLWINVFNRFDQGRN